MDTAVPTNDALTIRHSGAAIADGGTLYAGHTEVFEVKVSDADGTGQIQYVDIRLDGTSSYVVRWTESTDSFSEIAGGSEYDVLSDSADTTPSGNQWTLVFEIKFFFSLPWADSTKDPIVDVIDDAGNSATTVYSANSYYVENDLELRETALVGHWRFDDATGTTPGDSSGLRNTAAFAAAPGEPTWTAGNIGGALSFDGVDDYVTVPDSLSLSFTGPFTLSAWIRTNSNTVQQGIIEKYDCCTTGYALRLTGGGKLEVWIVAPSNVNALGATTITTGVWHHVAGVWDGAVLRVYLDGVQDGMTATAVGPPDSAATLKIGARGDDATNRFNGLIDEARVYARGLSAPEISVLASKVNNDDESRMIAGHHFEEGTGLSVADFSGLGDAAQICQVNSCPVAGPVWASGKIGNGLSFDGLDDYVGLSNLKVNTVAGGYNTVEFWMKWDGGNGVNADGMMPFGWGTSNGGTMNLWIHPGGGSHCLGFNAWQGGFEGIPFPVGTYANVWVHIAAGFYNNPGGADAMPNMKLYVNGALQVLSSASPCMDAPYTAARTATSVARFGHAEHHDVSPERDYFGGSLDELRIHNYDVPASLIAQHAKLAYHKGLRATGAVNGNLRSGVDWVKGSESLTWTGVTAYYQGTLVKPLDADFDIRVQNDAGGWVEQSTGSDLDAPLLADPATHPSDIHTIEIINVPGGGPHLPKGFEIKVDATLPTGTYSFTGGYYGTASVPITHSESDADSGLESWQFSRREATLAAGSCGSFGAFGDVGPANPSPSPFDDTTVVNGKCYLYRLSLADAAGNTDVISFGTTAKIDMVAPSVTVDSPAASSWHGLGTALSLDGVDDYADAPDTATTSITAPFTFEVWFRPDTVSSNQMIFDKQSGTGIYVKLRSDAKLDFGSAGGSGCTQGPWGTVTAGTWNHVAGSHDGTTQKLYLNGALINSWANPCSPTDNSAALRVGRKLDNTLPFDGAIDEFRLYGRILDDTEVADHFNGKFADRNSMRVHWDFDQGVGAAATDRSGNGNTATLANGASWYYATTGMSTFTVGVTDSDAEGPISCGYAVQDFGVYTVNQWKGRPCSGDPDLSVGSALNCRTEGADKCTFRGMAQDSATNMGITDRLFSIDLTSPDSSGLPADGWKATSIGFTASGSDSGGSGLDTCFVQADDLGIPGVEYPWADIGCGGAISVTVGSVGTCQTQGADKCRVMVLARDIAGNFDPTPQTVDYDIDYTAPTSSITPGDGWKNADFAVAVSESDTGGSGLATCYYEVDDLGRVGMEDSGSRPCNTGGNIMVGPAVLHCQTQGANQCRVHVWASDAAGNIGAGQTIDYDIDYTAPTIVINSPAASSWRGAGSFTLDVTNSDALSGLQYCQRYVESNGIATTSWQTYTCASDPVIT
ncbi:MAG TPA: LamG domain-containing protein, partial [Thermoplasmata archaeon]|nr:LamG domain-containing protein [Thermoplasmata archaeon]